MTSHAALDSYTGPWPDMVFTPEDLDVEVTSEERLEFAEAYLVSVEAVICDRETDGLKPGETFTRAHFADAYGRLRDGRAGKRTSTMAIFATDLKTALGIGAYWMRE